MPRSRLIAVSLLLLGVVVHAIPAQVQGPVVDLGYGRFQGVPQTGRAVTSFLGIPFAAPPTGELTLVYVMEEYFSYESLLRSIALRCATASSQNQSCATRKYATPRVHPGYYGRFIHWILNYPANGAKTSYDPGAE